MIVWPEGVPVCQGHTAKLQAPVYIIPSWFGGFVFWPWSLPMPQTTRNTPWSLPMSQTTRGTLLPVAYPAHDIANYMGHMTHTHWSLSYTTNYVGHAWCTAYPMQQTSWDNTSDLCIDSPNLVKWHERWTIQEETFSPKSENTKNTGLNIIMIKTCFMQQLWKDSEWEWMNEWTYFTRVVE